MVKNIAEHVIAEHPVAGWNHIIGGYRQALLVNDDGDLDASWKSIISDYYSQEVLEKFGQQLHDMLVCIFPINA